MNGSEEGWGVAGGGAGRVAWGGAWEGTKRGGTIYYKHTLVTFYYGSLEQPLTTLLRKSTWPLD